MIKIENVNKFMFSELDRLIETTSLKYKKIVLFGLNTSSYAAKSYLEDRGLQVYAYVDNDQKKRESLNEFLDEVMPRHFAGMEFKRLREKVIRAYTPEELLSSYDEDFAILIASKYYVTMCEQLKKMGYEEGRHIFQTVDFYGLDKILKDDTSTDKMKKLEPLEVRAIQLEILLHLKEVCESHNLRYYMTGGTLLGAVRHKGYIPWDDDIDITIPMPDYLKLIEVLKDDPNYETLSIYDYPDTYFNFFMRLIDKRTIMKSWEYPFLMTSGVSIDVFPLIALPEGNKEVSSFFNRIRHLNTKYISSFISFSEENQEVKDYRAKIRDEVIRMIEQYDYDSCSQMGYILSKYWEKDIMPRSIYDDKIEMQFEDITLAAPVGYKEYLERIFGDYMKLPPQKEQYVTHNYVAYRIDA